MTKAIKNLPSLSPFFVKENVTTNLLKNWEEWPDDFNIYLITASITQAQQKKLCYDVEEIYKTLKTDDEEYNAVVDKLNNYFKPKVNVAYERHVLKKQNKTKMKRKRIQKLLPYEMLC